MQVLPCLNISMDHTSARTETMRDYILLSAGTLLIAMAVKLYLIPCHIVTGSVSGLSLLISQISGISDSLLVLVGNLSCLLIGIRCLGKKFGMRCVYISVLLPVLMELLPDENIFLSTNQLLNIFVFLVLITSGQCMMFLLDTTSGGLDTIAEVLAKKLHLSVGLMIAFIGVFVSVLSIAVYGLETAIAGALVTAVNGLLVNLFIFIYDLARSGIRSTAKANI